MDKRLSLETTEKDEFIKELQQYFLEERDEEIGHLAASLLLEFLCEKLGPAYYNRGIRDALSFLSDRLEDLYGLEIR